MAAKVFRRWGRRGVLLVLVLAAVAVGWSWIRSYRAIDRVWWGRLRFDAAPMAGSPRGLWREQPDPPGTQWWQGELEQVRVDVFSGRVLVRIGTRPWYATSLAVTPEMASETGWHSESGNIRDAVSYNIPRGNVWISRSDFHWNGIGSWPFFINGDAAQFVMVPHWLLLALGAGPAALWWGVVGARRLRMARRQRAGGCIACGYDLRGLQGECPECGRASSGPRA